MANLVFFALTSAITAFALSTSQNAHAMGGRVPPASLMQDSAEWSKVRHDIINKNLSSELAAGLVSGWAGPYEFMHSGQRYAAMVAQVSLECWILNSPIEPIVSQAKPLLPRLIACDKALTFLNRIQNPKGSLIANSSVADVKSESFMAQTGPTLIAQLAANAWVVDQKATAVEAGETLALRQEISFQLESNRAWGTREPLFRMGSRVTGFYSRMQPLSSDRVESNRQVKRIETATEGSKTRVAVWSESLPSSAAYGAYPLRFQGERGQRLTLALMNGKLLNPTVSSGGSTEKITFVPGEKVCVGKICEASPSFEFASYVEVGWVEFEYDTKVPNSLTVRFQQISKHPLSSLKEGCAEAAREIKFKRGPKVAPAEVTTDARSFKAAAISKKDNNKGTVSSCYDCHERKDRGLHIHPALQGSAGDEEKQCLQCHVAHSETIESASQAHELTAAYPWGQQWVKRQEATAARPDTYELCFQCHDTAMLNQKIVTGKETQFRRYPAPYTSESENLHWTHVVNARTWRGDRESYGRTCTSCHSTHSTGQAHQMTESFMNPIDPTGKVQFQVKLEYDSIDRGGTCWKSCHETRSYRR